MFKFIPNARHWARALAILVGLSASARGGFTIRDLGAIVSPGTSGAEAINASGQVAGMASVAAGGVVAALSNGGGNFQQVALPKDATSSIADSINSAGAVAGYYYDKNGIQHGFETAGGQASTIDPLKVGMSQGSYTRANGINDGGQVVGTGNIPGGSTRAFIASGSGSPRIIGPLGNGTFDMGNGINAGGQIVGTSETSPGGLLHAFYTNASGIAVDLLSRNSAGSFQYNTYGTAIANDGDIVGYGDVGDAVHAFFASGKGGPLVDLGALPDASSTLAEAVNKMALVVGGTGDGLGGLGQYGQSAFLWGGSNGLHDLNTLIPQADQGKWDLTAATGINDSDQISGVGYIDGELHGFVLTPIAGQPLFSQVATVPGPPALLLSAMGLATASAWSRARLRRGRNGGRGVA